jgi:hypothetical protein
MSLDFAKWDLGRSAEDNRSLFQERLNKCAPRSDSKVNVAAKWRAGSSSRFSQIDHFYLGDAALDALITDSKYILESGDTPGEYSIRTWRRATDYLRRLALLADTTNRELPLPRITAAGEGSIDLLWSSRARILLLNFPGDEVAPTFFYRRETLELTGVLKDEAATEELLRWLIA